MQKLLTLLFTPPPSHAPSFKKRSGRLWQVGLCFSAA